MRFGYILLTLLLIGMILSPVQANTGLTVGPSQLAGSGIVTVTNTGTTPVNVTSDIIQIMVKDGNQVLEKTTITPNINPGTFTLASGESKQVSVGVPENNGYLYGIRFIGSDPGNGTIKTNIAVVVKIASGIPAVVNENLIITPKISPIGLSGIDLPIKYKIDNKGNIPENVTLGNKSKIFYPGDNGVMETQESIPFWYVGFFEVNTDLGKSTVFIFPTWALLIGLIGSAVWILRRKVEFKRKT